MKNLESRAFIISATLSLGYVVLAAYLIETLDYSIIEKMGMKIFSFIAALFLFLVINRLLKTMFKYPDPVVDCEVYKEKGCSFVDGIDCRYPHCHILKKYRENKENPNITPTNHETEDRKIRDRASKTK